MFGLPLAFATPWLLTALLSLPVIWWLLRLTPPRPQEEVFPPTRILARLRPKEETPARSPWWLTLLRLLMAALVIIAMSGPVWNPEKSALTGEGPVLVVVDDGWASAQDWEIRKNTALSIVSQARETGRTVILVSTTGRENWTGTPLAPDEAAGLLEAAEARPFEPDHHATARRIGEIVRQSPPGHISWLSDGLSRNENTETLSQALSSLEAGKGIYNRVADDLLLIEQVRNEPAELYGDIVRADSSLSGEYAIEARDEEGIVLARSIVSYQPGQQRVRFSFQQPVELRNQITRLDVATVDNAGAVQLLDEANRRRLVGLISGEEFDQNQPLLSPLYYISRALEPFADLRRSENANVAASVPDLINQGVSAIVLADVGVIPEETVSTLQGWIEKGGLLIRFAGPRLAASPDSPLLPVDIRPGDRNLGGALSWEEPKPLAAFERESPFFGLDAPRDVLVKRQLLALQEARLEEKTWAVLEDGTPLVTADKIANGWIVLFHVGSDAEWSNLPLSGTFVEMLRKTVNLSRSTGIASPSDQAVSLPPLRLLNGSGEFSPPDISVKPLALSSNSEPVVSGENPPGFYGTEDAFSALNLFETETELELLATDSLQGDFEQRSYLTGKQFELKAWLLLGAALLLLVDCVVVLWMAGALRFAKPDIRSSVAGIVLVFIMTLFSPADVLAQGSDNNETDFSSALETRLAYVRTGIAEIDEISEAGLRGLTLFLAQRTALEPGEPIGLDISSDELAFYSIIYWPVDPRAEIPTPETMARIDAFMKQGGSILFDTRDQVSGVYGGTAYSPAANALQQILSTLDIPPLEPVPSDHVITKSFYLLDSFPGRYTGGDLWVETTFTAETARNRPVRAGDGVSSILITSNDMAGAWAVDNSLRPLLPTVPPDPVQRNYAYRVGVNVVMYALTGNYKADQVHLPALLERLGQ